MKIRLIQKGFKPVNKSYCNIAIGRFNIRKDDYLSLGYSKDDRFNVGFVEDGQESYFAIIFDKNGDYKMSELKRDKEKVYQFYCKQMAHEISTFYQKTKRVEFDLVKINENILKLDIK